MLRLHLLGAFELAIGDRSIDRLYSDRTRALLAYLAVEADRPHRRGELATLLWPDVEAKKARQNLRQTLRRLQLAIDNAAANPPFLMVTRQTVQFNLAANQWVDVAAVRNGDVMAYRGGLLQQLYIADSDLFNNWATIQREALHREVLAQLRELGRESAETENFRQAILYAQKQVEIDPWREEAYRDWIRYLLADGQTQEAQRVYERCCRVLLEELGVEPTAETRELYQSSAQSHRTPVPASATLPPSNLPRAKAPLIGRSAELTAVNDLLANPDCRWLTLVGIGGTGKTRLALAAAQQFVESADFPNGIWFVSLVGATDLLPIATALNIAFHSDEPERTQLQTYLRTRKLLLLLDNCEELLHEGDWLTELLTVAPNVTLLTTSRQSFDQADEWVYDVGGLQITGEEETMRSESAELFIQAARRAFARFDPQTDVLTTIETICAAVQGHPLSIELVASWVRVLSVPEISAEISSSLTLFDTNLRRLPERQRSLRRVFDYTWNTLTDHERTIMAQLSVFRGGFDREAVQAVAGAHLLDLLQLINKSLLQRVGNRFVLHEAVRQYAAVQHADPLPAMRRHAKWYAAKLHTRFPDLFGNRAAATEEQIALEEQNIRAAWQTAVQVNEGSLLDQMLFPWGEFLQRNGRFQLFAEQLEAARDAVFSSEINTKLQAYHAWLLFELGNVHEANALIQTVLPAIATLPEENERGILLGNAARIFTRGQEPPDLMQQLDTALATTTLPIGEVHLLQGRLLLALKHNSFTEAESLGERCLTRLQATGYRSGVSKTYAQLGKVASRRQEYNTARQHFLEAVRLASQTGDRSVKLEAHNGLGDVYFRQGVFDSAETHWQTALELAQQLGIRRLIGRQRNNLGALYAKTGQPDRAQQSAQAYLDIAIELNDFVGQATALLNLAYMLRDQHDFPQMGRLFARSLVAAERADAVFRQIIAHYWLALTAIFLADFARAELHLNQSLALCRRQENTTFLLYTCFTCFLMAFLREDGALVSVESAETLQTIAQPLLQLPTANASPNHRSLHQFANLFIAIRRGAYTDALDIAIRLREQTVEQPFERIFLTTACAWLHLQLGNHETARQRAESIIADLPQFKPMGELYPLGFHFLLDVLTATESPQLAVAIAHIRTVLTTIETHLHDPTTRTRWRNFHLHRRIFDHLQKRA